jgi:uncharacterized protein (TIGR03067 family)
MMRRTASFILLVMPCGFMACAAFVLGCGTDSPGTPTTEVTPGLTTKVTTVNEGEELDANKKELQRLEGRWQEPIPKSKGPDSYNILNFQWMGHLDWEVIQTLDGEPVSKVTLLYKVEVDPQVKPKAITLQREEDPDRLAVDVRGIKPKKGIYEIEGGMLKLSFAIGAERPKGFGEGVREMVLEKKRR